jgi:3',5'-nucleoside bisphosphate phosphatase
LIGPLRPSTRFDLHMHSIRSDGRYPPQEVLERCASGGLDVVALTDHDLAGDIAPGVHRVGDRELYVVAAAEVSGTHLGREQHLLVYFSGEVPEGFREFCREQCRLRAARYDEAVRRLDLPGLAPPDEAAIRGDVALTRHHLARELVGSGHVKNLREAFQRYLGESHGLVPSITLPFVDAIRIAREYGGVTSWAHPPVPLLEPFLPAFVDAGLQGIEALRPMVTSDERKRYRSMARRLNLMLTGGSDWHGWSDDASLGLFRVEAREIAPFVDLLFPGAQVAA